VSDVSAVLGLALLAGFFLESFDSPCVPTMNAGARIVLVCTQLLPRTRHSLRSTVILDRFG
jgi:hypothetical protein